MHAFRVGAANGAALLKVIEQPGHGIVGISGYAFAAGLTHSQAETAARNLRLRGWLVQGRKPGGMTLEITPAGAEWLAENRHLNVSKPPTAAAHTALIIDALRRNPCGLMGRDGIAQETGLSVNIIRSYLPIMIKGGQVAVCGGAGRWRERKVYVLGPAAMMPVAPPEQERPWLSATARARLAEKIDCHPGTIMPVEEYQRIWGAVRFEDWPAELDKGRLGRPIFIPHAKEVCGARSCMG